MKSRAAKMIAGLAITATLGVAAFSVASVASAKPITSAQSTLSINRAFNAKSNDGRHGRPDLGKVASLFGMTSDELKTQLQSGKSLAAVAASKNVALSSVISAIVADIKTHLDAEVLSGEQTQAEANAKLAKATTRVTEMVNKVRSASDQRGPGRGGPGRGGEHGHRDLDKVAALLGMTSNELKVQLQSGKSLAAVAASKNVALSSVISAIVSDIKTHLDAEVLSGEQTQAEANANLAEATTRVTEMVNKVRSTGDQRGPGRGDHDTKSNA